MKKIQYYLKSTFALNSIKNCMLYAVTPAILFYAFSILILKHAGFETLQIIRDPAQQNNVSSFLGFLSNLGIWLWVSAAAICFFSVIMINKSIQNKSLLLLTGTLSILLAADDFFMIHDRYVDQNICYAVYAILAIAILFRHYELLIRVGGFAFIMAGVLLALSILSDLLQSHIPIDYNYTQLMEECFKFVGAATWLYANSKIAAFEDATPDNLAHKIS